MADTALHYEVSTIPRKSVVVAAQPADGFILNTILSVTNYNALKKLIQKLQSGTDISTVVTAINAL